MVGNDDLVVDFGLVDEERRNGDVRIFAMLDIELGNIDSDEIETVEQAVLVFAGEVTFIPALETVTQNHAELEVNMSSFAVNSGSGVTHDGNGFAGLDGLATRRVDCTEVGVKGKERSVTPVMVHDHILPVVAG